MNITQLYTFAQQCFNPGSPNYGPRTKSGP